MKRETQSPCEGWKSSGQTQGRELTTKKHVFGFCAVSRGERKRCFTVYYSTSRRYRTVYLYGITGYGFSGFTLYPLRHFTHPTHACIVPLLVLTAGNLRMDSAASENVRPGAELSLANNRRLGHPGSTPKQCIGCTASSCLRHSNCAGCALCNNEDNGEGHEAEDEEKDVDHFGEDDAGLNKDRGKKAELVKSEAQGSHCSGNNGNEAGTFCERWCKASSCNDCRCQASLPSHYRA